MEPFSKVDLDVWMIKELRFTLAKWFQRHSSIFMLYTPWVWRKIDVHWKVLLTNMYILLALFNGAIQ